MPELRYYDIFITHAWDYNDEYHRLVSFLKTANNFRWRNYSVPEHDPLPNRGLKQGLANQIRRVHCVLALAGMYVAYRDVIQYELEFATSVGKPVIAVRPWEQQNTPAALTSVAVAEVGWNTDTIVQAVRQYAL